MEKELIKKHCVKQVEKDAIILINKEKDFTSRDVVNKLQRLLNIKKIGHTGTLDPLATGVLVICMGKYTKLVEEITSFDKEYVATVKLGIDTDTLDTTGNFLEKKDYIIDKEEINQVLKSFLGSSMQTVPKYSAVKINGKKLYEYARENIEIKLPERKITIYDISLEEIFSGGFKFRVSVSKGTYIRSLIRDISVKLGTVGVMSDLVRTKQGKFKLEDTYFLSDIENNNYKTLNIEDVLEYPIYNLNDSEMFKVQNGAKINIDLEDNKYMLKYNNEIVAIYEFIDKIGTIKLHLCNNV